MLRRLAHKGRRNINGSPPKRNTLVARRAHELRQLTYHNTVQLETPAKTYNAVTLWSWVRPHRMQNLFTSLNIYSHVK
jgi:hypothetical protein